MGRCPLKGLLSWVARVKENGTVKILKPPQMGLVMMRGKDTVAQEVFNLGEVLVSDCTVTVDGQLGYGVVIGNQPRRAEAMAILDAVFRMQEGKWKELLVSMKPWLEEQAQLQQKEQLKEFNFIKRSRVNFEMMEDVGDATNGK